MKRLRGIVTMAAGALLVLSSGAVGLAPAEAESVLASYGWWYKPNQVPNNLAAPPAPPGVPSDGLFIAADPSGPFAIAAVRYVADGPGTLTLEFAPEGQTGLPAIAACIALVTWDGATAGRWDGVPAYDCVNSSEGVVSEDGAAMSFAVGPSLQRVEGTYDIVLAPIGPVPFGATFNAPRGTSLVTSGAEPSDDGEGFASNSEDSSSSTFDSGTESFSGSFDTTFPVLDDSRVLPSGDAGTPTAGPQLAPGRPDVLSVADPSPIALPEERGERIAAVAGLGLLLLGAWWFGGRTVRPPRLLGSMAGRAGPPELVPAVVAPAARPRGIGRFSRPG